MRRVIVWCVGGALASGLSASAQQPIPIQVATSQPEAAPTAVGTSGGAAGAGAILLAPAAEESGATKRFVVDVVGDYKHFFSVETAKWLGFGGLAAVAIHPADDDLREETQEVSTLTSALSGGQVYGGVGVQLPLALGWWIVGHAVGSERGASAGRDLLRAQISAVSWTYAFKFPVNRTRPNGEPRSFPSGHASSTFATAMVLEEYYGWKLGAPAFAAAVYTAASRVTNDKHWASDVVFGAFLGMASARTVTLHMRNTRVSIAPMVVPGGGGVLVSRVE